MLIMVEISIFNESLIYQVVKPGQGEIKLVESKKVGT